MRGYRYRCLVVPRIPLIWREAARGGAAEIDRFAELMKRHCIAVHVEDTAGK